MEIEWAILCQEMRTTAEGISLLGVNMDTILCDETLPDQVQIICAACLVAEESEMRDGSVHQAHWSVTGPEGTTVGQGSSGLFSGVPPGLMDPPGTHRRTVYRSQINFRPTEGEHMVQIWVDEGVSMSLELGVWLATTR